MLLVRRLCVADKKRQLTAETGIQPKRTPRLVPRVLDDLVHFWRLRYEPPEEPDDDDDEPLTLPAEVM